MTQPALRPSPRLVWAIALGLVLVTLLLYARAVTFEFVNFDDTEYIKENRFVRRGLSVEGTRWAFTTVHAANWHPLTWLSLMLDAELFGPGPAGFHATNVVLHAANVVLLFLLLLAGTGALGRSTFVAALFAVHPLHAESVAWVTERKDVLSTFFGLLALGAYGAYARQRSLRWYLALILAYALSLLSKQMFVTLPVLLLLVDIWPLRLGEAVSTGDDDGPADWSWTTFRRKLPDKIPLFLLGLGASIAIFIIQRQGGAVSRLETMPILYRLTNAIHSTFMYFFTTIVPTNLAFYYPHPLDRLGWPRVAAEAAFLLLVTLVAFQERRRRPFLLAGWLWYLVALAPIIGIIQIGTQARADRYTYVPHLGLFVMLTWGAWSISLAPVRQVLKLAAPGLVALAAILAWFQVGTWATSRALAQQALAATTDNAMALQMMGETYLDNKEPEEALKYFEQAAALVPQEETVHSYVGLALDALGRTDEALAAFERAAQINPRSERVLNHLAQSLAKHERKAEAIALYRKILEMKPDSVVAHNNLALALWEQKDVAPARDHFQTALALDPTNVGVLTNLATLLAEQGDVAQATLLFERAIALEPDNSSARANLGTLLAKAGKPNEALAQFRIALAADPDNAELHANLARAHLALRDVATAITEYTAALALDPKLTGALNDLAWIRATAPAPHRDTEEALRLAATLAAEEDRTVEVLDTLAAAHAAAGRFDEAVTFATSARDRAQADNQPDLARQIGARLALYRSGRSFSDPALQ